MNTRDIRLGNLVNFQGLNIEIGFSDISLMQDDNVGSSYKPIPLTEEWLVKFGFEVLGDSMYAIDDRFIIHFPDMVHYKTNVKIKYIHDLQNLFFALNRKELTWK